MSKRGLLLGAAAAVCVAAAPASGRLHDVGVLTDPTGDGTPDITRVRVGSNPSAVTFIVDLANKTRLGEEEAIFVFVDSDLNHETGVEGFEFALVLVADGARMLRWDGTNFVDAESQTVYGYSYSGFRIAVDRNDLGLTTPTLRFGVLTFPLEGGDMAPDGDQIAEYLLSDTALALQVARFTSAKTVAAGKRFTTTLQVRRNDLAELSSAGLVRCTAKYGAKAVKVTATFPADRATCSGVVPRAAKGKTLKVTTTFELDGVRISRTASIKVR